ncbi:MAG: substrate-binding domain-containing protein [Planctomycetia bacterium]|jgi:LacI family transcriptional regulator|nr:substrate-binding domain-containing protein [Planctomycetia bacterium]
MRKNRRVLFLGNLTIAYNRNVLRGVAEYAARQPEIRVFFPDNFEPADLPNLIQGDIQGVIAAGCPPKWNLPMLIKKRGVPAVDVGAELEKTSLPRVITDDAAVGRLAADYFIDRGFKRLVYYGMSRRYWSDVRCDGFCAQASQRSATVQCFQKAEAEAEDRAGLFPGTVAHWLKRLTRPTAIFAGNDMLGTYLVEACQHLKIRVPEDIAILGVDNDDLYGQLRTPHLSSILQDSREIGVRAMELLYRLMPRRKISVTTTLVPPIRVITRLSSDIFGVEDELVRKALGVMQQQLRNGVRVRGVLRELVVSRPTLERRFLAALGRTPAKEIQRIQLETARQLVLDSDLPLAKVADETGYRSPRQFSTAFHHYYKQTPRDMRKAHRYTPAAASGSDGRPVLSPSAKR